jgi:hypothetical protein
MPASVFFVTALSEVARVRERVESIIAADDRFDLASDKWMVSYEGTARELAEKVGIRGGDDRIGTGLALPVTTYSGRAPSALWEWLSKKGL